MGGIGFKLFIKNSDLINRAHDMQTYYDGVAKLKQTLTCVHILMDYQVKTMK